MSEAPQRRGLCAHPARIVIVMDEKLRMGATSHSASRGQRRAKDLSELVSAPMGLSIGANECVRFHACSDAFSYFCLSERICVWAERRGPELRTFQLNAEYIIQREIAKGKAHQRASGPVTLTPRTSGKGQKG